MSDTDVKFMLDMADFFERQPSNGEDRQHWANVYNAENARRIAARLLRDEWNPIASAPKDREIVLYCADTGEQFVAFWGTAVEDGSVAWVVVRVPNVSFVVRSPTHWRELFAKPRLQ